MRFKVVINNERNTASVMGNEPGRVDEILIRESTVEALCRRLQQCIQLVQELTNRRKRQDERRNAQGNQY